MSMLSLITGLVIAALLLPPNAWAEAAIAFSQEDYGAWHFGTAYNYQKALEANNAALERCNSEGGINCVIVTNFSDSCAAVAVQVGNNGWSAGFGTHAPQAEKEALMRCMALTGLQCKIAVSFCDSVKEAVKTVICVHPVFTEEYKLRQTIDGSPQRTDYVAAAINYLRLKYCREIEGLVTADHETHIGDNCYQRSGFFRGERVFWGECLE